MHSMNHGQFSNHRLLTVVSPLNHEQRDVEQLHDHAVGCHLETKTMELWGGRHLRAIYKGRQDLLEDRFYAVNDRLQVS